MHIGTKNEKIIHNSHEITIIFEFVVIFDYFVIINLMPHT